MIKLYDSNITDILPESLSDDPKVQALGYAVKRAMQRLINYCQNIGVYSSIDTVPEQVLDLLAVELNTQYYDTSMSIEVKRNIIKNTMLWYTKTGTKAAVQELVENIFGNGDIQEWFDYGGDPFCFKVTTSNINSTDDMIQQLESIVSSVQNARSHLDSVIIDVMQQFQIYSGCAIEVVNDLVTIDMDMNLNY